LDLTMSDLESLSRDELIALALRQEAQITTLATQLSAVMEKFEQQAAELAKLQHLMSRNSDNSNFPSSKDGGIGGTPPRRERRATRAGRGKGRQPGAPGSALHWYEEGEVVRRERFPEGLCVCGADLAHASDLGVVDRYQQHEIPLVSVTVTQYEQHAAVCGCGRTHTARRPEGAGAGRSEYGPNLRAFAVYLLVVHFVPVERVVEILTALTGATPSTGFVHSLLRRAARAFTACDFAIRTLITLAFAVCADETPLKVGPATPAEGRKEAKAYLHVACTGLYTHFLLGDRSMKTFLATVLQDLETGAVVIHDRYQSYDSAKLGRLNHQLCLAHALRDLTGAAELYPDQAWPTQLADELRELIHRCNQARRRGEAALAARVKDLGLRGLRAAVRLGLAHTAGIDDPRPGARKSRLLLEAFEAREDDFLRFTTDLRIPPTSNQAERDLRPSKIQEKISGRLTDFDRTKDRYLIRGVLATAVKHDLNPITVLRDMFTGTIWLPPAATTAT
jgi:transposase